MSRQVRVCLGASCRRSGAPELFDLLEQALAEDEDVEVSRYLCFGGCGAAPNVVVMSERLWYSYVLPDMVEQVVAAIRRGEPLSLLANHVRSMIQDAVFQKFEREDQ